MSRIRVILAAALLGLAAACGGPSVVDNAAVPDPSSSSGATESASTPITEGPAATSRKPSGGGEPVLTVPEFPIGGGDDGDKAVRCVTVNYLSDVDIPPGVGLVVGDAKIVQEGGPYFTTDRSGCSDEPACVGFTWNVDNRNDQCSVSVRETGKKKAIKDKRPNPELVLSGRLDCPEGQKAACATFKTALKNAGRPVRIAPPEADDPPSSSPTPTPSSGPTSTAGGN